MTENDGPEGGFVSKARLEFLSDGVFAIAMTILVIEIKVPELGEPRSARALVKALSHGWYGPFGWMLRILLLGLMWARAHRQFHYVLRVTRAIFACNLWLMASAALLPFCVGVYAHYPLNAASYLLYFGTLELYQLGVAAQLWFASRQGALDPGLAPDTLRAFRRKNRLGALLPLAILALLLLRSQTQTTAH